MICRCGLIASKAGLKPVSREEDVPGTLNLGQKFQRSFQVFFCRWLTEGVMEVGERCADGGFVGAMFPLLQTVKELIPHNRVR